MIPLVPFYSSSYKYNRGSGNQEVVRRNLSRTTWFFDPPSERQNVVFKNYVFL